MLKLFLSFLLVLFSFSAMASNSIGLYLKASDLESAGKFTEAAAIVKEMLKEEKSVHLYLKIAELLLSDNKGDEAIEVLKAAEVDFPNEAIFKYFLGQLYEFNKKNLPLAYKYYAEAMKLNNNIEYILSAARVKEALGEYGVAVALVTTAIKQDENNSQYYSDRGRLNLKLGDKPAAIRDLEKAIDINENISALLRLSDIYLNDSMSQEAKVLLEKVISKGADLILPEIKLSEIYLNEKEYDKTIELYQKIADRLEGKERASVLKQLAALQYELKDYDNASRNFEWVVDLDPQDSMSGYFSGYIYEYSGNVYKARAVYNKTLQTHPTFAQVLKRLAILDLINKDSDNATKMLSRVDEIERDVDYYVLQAESYSLAKKHDKAIIKLIEGLKDNPTSIDILYALAMQYEHTKEREKAIDAAKKALKVEPENPMLLNFLGYIYADMNINLDKAREYIDKAIAADPKNPAYIDSKAWLLFRLKEYKKANELINEAIKLTPDDPEVKLHYNEIRKFK